MNFLTTIQPEQIRTVNRLRSHLCIGEHGHRATESDCRECQSRCSFGRELLKRLGEDAPKPSGSIAEIMRTPSVTIRDGLKRRYKREE